MLLPTGHLADGFRNAAGCSSLMHRSPQSGTQRPRRQLCHRKVYAARQASETRLCLHAAVGERINVSMHCMLTTGRMTLTMRCFETPQSTHSIQQPHGRDTTHHSLPSGRERSTSKTQRSTLSQIARLHCPPLKVKSYLRRSLQDFRRLCNGGLHPACRVACAP